jgi:hypothetical protein
MWTVNGLQVGQAGAASAELRRVQAGAVSAEPCRVQAAVAAEETGRMKVAEDEPGHGIGHGYTKSYG